MASRQNSRSFAKRKGFVGQFLQNGGLAEKMEAVEVADRIAAVIAPLCKAHMLGSEITGAQCEITRQWIWKTYEDPYEVNDEDPFAREERLVLRLHLKNTASLARLKQIKGTLEAALMNRGFGNLMIEGICDPKAYQGLERPEKKPFVSRKCYDKASIAAEKVAASLDEKSPLKAAMMKLSAALAEKKS